MAGKKIIASPEDADDDALPRDIDEMRDELARRVRALRDASAAAASPPGPKLKAKPKRAQ